MANNILILSNSNYFSVLSHLYIHRHFPTTTLNVRYPNEEMDANEHLFHQFQEHFHDLHMKRGMITDRFSYDFNESLAYRVHRTIAQQQPSIILIELCSFHASEWQLLHFLSAHFAIPIIAFVSSDVRSASLMFQLAENGVREVITQFDETLFLNAFHRNI